MKKMYKLLACLVIASGVISVQPIASAQTAKAKPAAKAKTAKPAAAPAVQDEDDMEPDVGQSKTFDYKCELGNSLTLYTNVDDDKHAALRWKKRLYRMTRIETTTGAHRFENKKAGLVWIGIPAKGLLLDSIRGQQLANECKTPEPAVAPTEAAVATATQAPATK